VNWQKIDMTKLISIAEEAGQIIMGYYNNSFDVMKKDDDSPVTAADFAASKYIVDKLAEFFPDIPALSEESDEVVFKQRRQWKNFFLIDPLDGTKEFIKRSHEFTVNIAYISDCVPYLGVIHIPAEGVTYYGSHKGSFIKDSKGTRPLPVKEFEEGKLNVMISKSHLNEETKAYIEDLKSRYEVEYFNVGSSIKICKVAEGSADLNPRLGVGTKEWDIAAGHAIVIGAGGDIHILGTTTRVPYNKESLHNPEYEVKRKELLKKF
jgi:3'(2'), 5'-bisphosphate nucleotidase